MKKKVLSIMLCLALTASAVGCGSGGSEDNGEKPEEAELNILMSFPQYMEQWEGYCRQFEEKMLEEENIKVKVNLEMQVPTSMTASCRQGSPATTHRIFSRSTQIISQNIRRPDIWLILQAQKECQKYMTMLKRR